LPSAASSAARCHPRESRIGWNDPCTAYRRNILNDRKCKITAFHATVQRMLDADAARSGI
jgi:hypothetical protein